MLGVVSQECLDRYKRDKNFLEREKQQTIKVLANIERQLVKVNLFINQIEREGEEE